MATLHDAQHSIDGMLEDGRLAGAVALVWREGRVTSAGRRILIPPGATAWTGLGSLTYRRRGRMTNTGDGLRALGIDTLVEMLERLPDACTLSRAIRDASGRAIDMTLLWMNASARAGQPEPELAIGRTCSELWPRMLDNGSFGACMRVLDSGEAERGEFEWDDAATYRAAYYEWRASRVGDDLLLWVLRDASDRFRRALESEAFVRAILEAAPDAIVSIDARGTILSSNAACERMLGWAPGELRGQPVQVLMESRDADAHPSHLSRYLETGERHIIGIGREVRARHRSGRTIPIRLSIGETRIEGQRFFVGVLQDLSLREQLEQQLLHSQKLEMVGRLVSGVSHDFNNMLTVVTTTASLLELTVTDPEQRELLEEIVEAAERGTALTRQLLTYSRKEIGAPVVIDVDRFLEQLLSMVRRLVGDRIRVELALASEGATISADAGALEQALLNLAANARDAMPEGGTLTLRTLRTPNEGSGARVHIVVEDTGIGMTPDVLARAFDAFFTTKPAGRGTGLGLASVRELANRAGGRVEVRSEPGHGTSVELVLPRADAAATPTRVLGRDAARGRDTVLFVDDDPTIRRLVERALSGKGYRVLAAANASEARAVFDREAHALDVLVTDVVMPGLTGPDLVRELRTRRPDLKVIFVSGYAPEGVLSLNALPSQSVFLAKPFTPRQLATRVRELLDLTSPHTR